MDYSELNERILVPHWLSALGIAAGSDAIATCPRRLALSLAPQFNLQVLKPPFAALPIVVSMARRRDVRDHGIDWLAEQVQRAVRVTT